MCLFFMFTMASSSVGFKHSIHELYWYDMLKLVLTMRGKMGQGNKIRLKRIKQGNKKEKIWNKQTHESP